MMGKGRNSAKEVKMERKIIQKVREKETVKVTLIAFAKKPFSQVKYLSFSPSPPIFVLLHSI